MKIITLFSLVFLVSSQSFAASNESSFTPTSVKTPIRGIYLIDSSTQHQARLYECAGNSEAQCLVDVADNTALAALFDSQSASIDAGSYDSIQISTCKDEGEYNIRVKGSVTLGGTLYYTALTTIASGTDGTLSSTDPLSTSSNDLDYATVRHAGCAKTYTLPEKVTVKDGDSIKVNLFMAMQNVAFARLTSNAVPGGCVQNNAGNESVCVSYPEVVPYVGTVSPVLETYHVTRSQADTTAANADGQILLIVDTLDNILGGFSRRLYSQTSSGGGSGYDTPLRTISKNSGGTSYNVENYGSSATTSYLQFPNFLRSTHNGTFTNVSNSSTVNYRAVKQ
jgi:hypothetical protein